MAASRSSEIDTSKVTDRRPVRFSELAAALADAERCVIAEQSGRLRRSGNWSVGKTLGHLAYWIDGAFDGYENRPPWILRVIGPWFKNRVIRPREGLPKGGMRLPGVVGGTYGVQEYAPQEGLRRFDAAVRRLQSRCPEKPNPVFGRMTHDEWQALHCRHAELHLSFLHPQ